MSSEWSLCGVQKLTTFLSRTVSVHPASALPFALADVLALKTQYGQDVAQDDRDGLPASQTYNCRLIQGSNEHSEHSHAIAIDIRPWMNPLSDLGVLNSDIDLFGLDDGVAFIMAFYKAGFRWGGLWLYPATEAQVRARLAANHSKVIPDGRIDPMHFELELTPTQVAARDYAGEIAAAVAGGEDDMFTDADRALLKSLDARVSVLEKNVGTKDPRVEGVLKGIVTGAPANNDADPATGPFVETGKGLAMLAADRLEAGQADTGGGT